MTGKEDSRPEEYSMFDQCIDGAKVTAIPGAYFGGKYGFRTGTLGAIGTGGITAVLTVPVATAIGAAGGAVVGGAVGCVGNIMLQEQLSEVPGPLPTPRLAPLTSKGSQGYGHE